MTPRAAVLGHPIDHSLSPVLHRAAYAELGLDWSYDAIDMDGQRLPEFLGSLGPEWRGLSLTMPLKEVVLPYLTTQSETVTAVGGANTVLLTNEGLVGDNTDVSGIVAALREGNVTDGLDSLAIIGAGATAAASVVAAQQLRVREVVLCARRPEAAAQLATHSATLGITADVIPWADMHLALQREAVICALPGDAGAGLVGQVPGSPGVLLDVSYDPWPTSLAHKWSEAGGTVVGGHRMLLWQAADQVTLMTGQPAPLAAMSQALSEAMSAENR